MCVQRRLLMRSQLPGSHQSREPEGPVEHETEDKRGWPGWPGWKACSAGSEPGHPSWLAAHHACEELQLGTPPKWTYPGIPGGQAVGRQLLALQGALLGAVEGSIAAQLSGDSKLDAQMLASGHSSIKLHCVLQAQASSGKAHGPSWWTHPLSQPGGGRGQKAKTLQLLLRLHRSQQAPASGAVVLLQW